MCSRVEGPALMSLTLSFVVVDQKVLEGSSSEAYRRVRVRVELGVRDETSLRFQDRARYSNSSLQTWFPDHE